MLSLDPRLFHPDAISPETRDFNRVLEATLAMGPAMHEVAPATLRAARERGEGVVPPGGPLEGAEWRDAPTGAGRVRITAPAGAPKGIFLHIHGGGWTIGTPVVCDAWMRDLAEASGALCVSIQYRLAPEDPWPAPADDCEAAAVWALETLAPEYGLDRVAIGGESAGAHLAAVTLLRLKARGLLGLMAGGLFHYGCFDLRMTPSMAAWGARNLILSTPTVEWFADNLTAGDRTLHGDPALSPLLADLGGMPPALFQCGTADPLIDDTLFMAQRWVAAGAAAETAIYPGGVHAFDMFDLEIARQARARGAAFLSEIFTA